MACKSPLSKGFYSVPCGGCDHCRVSHQMNWVTRLKLEHIKRPYCYFVTLNYSDEFLPVFFHSKKAELYKPDLVNFIKRVRHFLPKVTVFAVGEYGGYLFGSTEAKRPIHPHYHLLIFSDNQEIDYAIRDVVDRCWDFGFTHIVSTSGALIHYITGYCLKKFTSPKALNFVTGLLLRPEFIYSSRNPAIGDISRDLVDAQELSSEEIKYITVDGKDRKLGKYLVEKARKLRLSWDLDLKNTGDYIIYETRVFFEREERMQKLSQKIALDKKVFEAAGISAKEVKKQKILNFASKLKKFTHNRKERIL